MDKKINDFVIFCLECYKMKEKLSGKEAFKIFDEYKVFDYLISGYDMLHTQGREWLMDDIDKYLSIRGYNR